MRITVIPAQITTIEDKIAGNLSLTQILLLLMPLFISACIYILLPQKLHLTLYKLPLILVSFLTCSLLALRIKGKVILHWLVIFTRYYIRPRLYLFNKNDPFLRDKCLQYLDDEHIAVNSELVGLSVQAKDPINISVPDLVNFEKLVNNPKTELKFSFNRKGGMNVAYQKIEK